jgi:hypothetical protein
MTEYTVDCPMPSNELVQLVLLCVAGAAVWLERSFICHVSVGVVVGGGECDLVFSGARFEDVAVLLDFLNAPPEPVEAPNGAEDAPPPAVADLDASITALLRGGGASTACTQPLSPDTERRFRLCLGKEARGRRARTCSDPVQVITQGTPTTVPNTTSSTTSHRLVRQPSLPYTLSNEVFAQARCGSGRAVMRVLTLCVGRAEGDLVEGEGEDQA